jgi:hypothetical protein
MNLEKFKEKYSFAKNMEKEELKEMMLFLLILLFKMSLSLDKEKSIEEFFTDIRNAINNPN